MDKEDVVYIDRHTQRNFIIKMNEILPFTATCRADLQNIMLSKISQRERDKYMTQSFIYGIKKIK